MEPRLVITLIAVLFFFSDSCPIFLHSSSQGIYDCSYCGLVSSAHAQSKQEINDQASQHILAGVNLYRQGRYQNAFDAWQKALVLYRTAGDRNGQAVMLRNFGVASLEINKLQDAVRYLSESLSLSRQLGDMKATGDLLELLGKTYRKINDFTKAVDMYEQLLQHSRDTVNGENEIIALGSLGIIYEFLKNYEKATSYQQQAVALARHLRDRSKESMGLWHLGVIYLENENYVQAIAYFWQSLLIFRELGDDSRQTEALWKLGNCYYFLGAYDKSIRYLEESQALALQQGDTLGQSRALRSLGSVYYFQDDPERAVEYYQKDLTVVRELKDEKREGTALGNLALALTSLGKYAQALEYHKQDLAIARKLGDSLSEGQALINLASVYISLEKYQSAIDACKNGISIFTTLKYRRGEGIALTNMGFALFKARRFKQAEQALIDAIAVFEGIREKVSSMDAYHVSLFETHLRTYRYLQMTMVALGREQEALAIAEQGRARALGELLRRRTVTNHEQAASVLDLSEIRQIARSNHALFVEYSIISEEALLYIWVVQPDGHIVFKQSDLASLPDLAGNSLAKRVTYYRRSIGLAGRGVSLQGEPVSRGEQAANDLYRVLIQPIEKYLPQDPDTAVVVIPQGPLFLVPFAALADDQGQYLLDRFTFITAPSMQTFQLANANSSSSASSRKSALVVGNPTMPVLHIAPDADPVRLPDLPGAELEAHAIAKLLGTSALTGKHATKQAVVRAMRDSGSIHLATHGLLDDLKGLGVPGALALAPSAADDGILTSADIMNMRLKADLVVLSACDTGQGQITGDGVIGLSRSFIAAGVPSVVVSLWKVPDIPTAELMTSFYQHLKRNYPKAAALRRAMLKTRQLYPQPANWAAFTLVGDIGRRP